jgi:putative addiction module killer protein
MKSRVTAPDFSCAQYELLAAGAARNSPDPKLETRISEFMSCSTVTFMLPNAMPEIRYYVASGGQQPFDGWFADLESVARAKVTRAIVRLEQGNFSNVKSVGEGVFEYRIDFGPGYRVYFGQDGPTLVILLTGGTKKRQQRDIDAAHAFWRDYKETKRAQR